MQDYWIVEPTNMIYEVKVDIEGLFKCVYQPLYSNLDKQFYTDTTLLEYFPKRYFKYEKIINEIYYPNGFIGKKWEGAYKIFKRSLFSVILYRLLLIINIFEDENNL